MAENTNAGTARTGSPTPGVPRPPGIASLKERVGALRNLRPFIAMVWQTSPTLTTWSLLIRLARALLPVATLYVGKLIIDDVVLLLQAEDRPATLADWLASGRLNGLALLLAAEFALAVAADVLGRVVALVDSLLSERVTNASSVRLMQHAATLDLEDFEDAEFQDQLERARRQTSGRLTLMGQLLGQAQDMVTVASFAAGLIVYAPWLIVLLLLALVPAFVGESHFNAKTYSLDFGRTPERRELDYVRQTAASVETAKEVKIFGLNGFLIDRYMRLACRFLRGQPQAGAATGRLGRRIHGDRHDRLLHRLRLDRLADACRRVFGRRPDLSCRIVPAPAHASGRPAVELLDHRQPGALPQRSVLLLRGQARDPVARKSAALSQPDPRGFRVRGCRLHLSGRRQMGGSPPQLHAEGG